jgi:hypothetical protein
VIASRRRKRKGGNLRTYLQAIYDQLEEWPDFFAEDGPHFVEKTVILDSRQIDTLLAIPL